MDTSKSPNRIPWPPILLVVTIGAGLAINMALPLNWLPSGAAISLRIGGIFLIVSALYIDFLCFRFMRRHATTILPHRGADHLITTGPYARSRNPIYVGNVALVIGLGLVFGNIWLIIGAAIMAFAVKQLAIQREEAHLAAKFGREWHDYAKRVRRWI